MLKDTSLQILDVNDFATSLDTSKAVDIINGKQSSSCNLPKDAKVLFTSLLLCAEISKRVQLTLTTDCLMFCSSGTDKDSYLLYNPIPIKHVSIRTAHSEKELLGEYSFELLIQKQKLFTLISKSEEERNMWLGMDKNSNNFTAKSFSSWRPLNDILEFYHKSNNSVNPKFRNEATQPIFQSGVISSDEENDNNVVDYNYQPPRYLEDKSLDTLTSLQENLMIKDKSSPPEGKMTSQRSLDVPKGHDEAIIKASTDPCTVENVVSMKSPNSSSIPASNRNPVEESSTTQSFSELSSIAQTSNGEPKSQPNLLAPPTPEKSKRSSFIKSVFSAVSNRSSFLQLKNQNKSSPDRILKQVQNKSLPNISTSNPSINQQEMIYQQPEPPVLPQHHTLPFSQAPVLYRQSMPSFTSMASSSQSSLNMTPPLSRPSSPPTFSSRYYSHSASSSEDFGTPPGSPDAMNRQNLIKSILYSSDQFKVFRWKDESWCTVETDCVLEVRQTFSNRSCLAVHMQNSGHLYLNAWILPDTHVGRTSDTDLSLSLHITNSQSAMEDYLFHCENKSEVDNLNVILEQMHQESISMNTFMSATSTLRGTPPVVLERAVSLSANNVLTPEELEKTLKLAMQCKCKLYVQSGSSKWSSFGSVNMKVSQQYTTKKMHIAIESHKKGDKITQLVSAMVQSNNVERLNAKRVSFMLVDEQGKNSVIYMAQVREEATCDKIIEYIKTVNAENGW